MSSNASAILFANSSLLDAETHSDLSFRIIIKSPASTGIGSVGISPEPILETTCKTSGKLSKSIFSAFVVAFIVFESELPVITRVSTAKSPSSSVGINSPPKFLNTITAITKSPKVLVRIIALLCIDHLIIGLYTL